MASSVTFRCNSSRCFNFIQSFNLILLRFGNLAILFVAVPDLMRGSHYLSFMPRRSLIISSDLEQIAVTLNIDIVLQVRWQRLPLEYRDYSEKVVSSFRSPLPCRRGTVAKSQFGYRVEIEPSDE